MKSKPALNMEKIANALGAQRVGKVTPTAGYFGALQLVAEVQSRFRTPVSGGRSTDPSWTERRLIPLAPKTLEKLEHLARAINERSGGENTIAPLQVAALLLEQATEAMSEQSIEKMASNRS